MNKGQLLTLKITDLNNLGCGVGRDEAEGKVVFVKGAVTGDTVRASVIKVNKSYAVAKLCEVIEASPHRTDEAFCDVPLACGGCMYRAITYEHELRLKADYVKNAFIKAGLREVTVLPTLSTGEVRGYRNKAQYPVASTKNGIRAGFYSGGTHSIVPAEHCAIQHKDFAPIVDFICQYATEQGLSAYDETTGKGLLRHIYLRIAEATGEMMVCLVLNGDALPDEEGFVRALLEKFPSVASVLLNTNQENTNVVLGKQWKTLYGTNAIEDILCGLRFRISADSFYQVNRAGAELLYGKAAELADLSGGEILVDLYCGTGTIGLSMAKKAKKLVGVEIVEGAVECAKENAERNGVENAEFYCGDASSREMILRCTGGKTPDVVVIDPPRKGSTRELVECLSSLNVKKIVYVSCNPDTLARDCAWFAEAGYSIGTVQPVDLFPRTGHVESVVCLTRK
ncbi:MAG: 23S rRNA (uracil(1939)-C(5))-methyltransferase RlmD [Clostridia bacterium]|nr:23S rRNA (uracil(1939)-C(5))-methyltransferase RlmD [Clostridia bacterium]